MYRHSALIKRELSEFVAPVSYFTKCLKVHVRRDFPLLASILRDWTVSLPIVHWALFIAFSTLATFTMPVGQAFATQPAEPSEAASVIWISNSARMGVRALTQTSTGYTFQTAQFTAPFLVAGTLLAINSFLYERFFSKNNHP